jgi:hypothetical protein
MFAALLEKILTGALVKILREWGALAYKAVTEFFRKKKRAKDQEKAVEKIEEHSNKNTGREERRKDEEDYLNS